MMMNYFSIMNPSSSYLSTNWFSMTIPFLTCIIPMFILPMRLSLLQIKLYKMLKKELKPLIMMIYTPSFLIMFSSIFTFIMTSNLMSLFPHIFTHTSHMIFNLSLAFPMWLTFIIFAWLKNTNSMLTHLTPQNTPNQLIPFMILIEIISQSIRPMTLAIRLTTNMIAGHLLLTLLTFLMTSLTLYMNLFTMPTLLILITLETAVALIQAYVFMILLILYAKEIN